MSNYKKVSIWKDEETILVDMTEDPNDMEPPWWELAAIGVAFTAVFFVGVFVGRFTA